MQTKQEFYISDFNNYLSVYIIFLVILFSSKSMVGNTDILQVKVEQNFTVESSIDTLPPSPKEEVYVVVENMPRFPGCEDIEGTEKDKKDCADKLMLEYVYGNLKYPKEALEAGKSGLSYLSFIVRTDGNITDINLLRDPGYGMGEEAIRIVESMKEMEEKWTVGTQRGKLVSVVYKLPITFRLPKEK